MLVSVTDDRQGSGHQQLPQISVALLGDAAQLLLATTGVLPRHKSPIQAARMLLPDLKAVGSGTVATMALASTGPTPGTSINRQPNSVDRALDQTRRSFSSTWSFTSPNWQTNGASGRQCHRRHTLIVRVAQDGDQSLNAIAAHRSH